jgi:hypothetical protein
LASWSAVRFGGKPVVPEGTLASKCVPTQDSAALHPGLKAPPPLRGSAVNCAITHAPEQTSVLLQRERKGCRCKGKERAPMRSENGNVCRCEGRNEKSGAKGEKLRWWSYDSGSAAKYAVAKLRGRSAQDDNSEYGSHYFTVLPTSFFNVFTFVKSSNGSSTGVSAMKAAPASRGSFNSRRNAGKPMLPFPIC